MLHVLLAECFDPFTAPVCFDPMFYLMYYRLVLSIMCLGDVVGDPPDEKAWCSPNGANPSGLVLYLFYPPLGLVLSEWVDWVANILCNVRHPIPFAVLLMPHFAYACSGRSATISI